MFLHGLVVLLFLLDVSSLQARGASADQIDQQILEIERYLDAGDPDERDASRDAQAWKNIGKSPLETPPHILHLDIGACTKCASTIAK